MAVSLWCYYYYYYTITIGVMDTRDSDSVWYSGLVCLYSSIQCNELIIYTLHYLLWNLRAIIHY